jgi:hypothetical protein
MENTKKTDRSRTLNVISNRQVAIVRYRCPFCTDSRNHKPPSFRTSWAAIWHLSHTHKNEADFEKEIGELKRLAKTNYLAQMEKI